MQKSLTKIESIPFPTLYGDFDLAAYETHYASQPDMTYALVISTPVIPANPIVRIHSSCTFGDVFGSLYCDCREQLAMSLEKINKEGGIILYLDQEGRSHGLINKTKELKLQTVEGIDTVDASLRLDLEVDARDFQVVGDILQEMNINKVRLLTNNPEKIKALEKAGIVVERQSLEIQPNKHNLQYQLSKKKKLKHLLNEFIN